MEDTKAEVLTESTNEEKAAPVDVAALMAKMEQVEQTNQRLLQESRDNKNKYRELRTDVDTQEKVKLEESENWKELLDREKNEKMQLAEQVKTYKTQSLKKHIDFEVARLVPNAFDVNDVINSIPRDMLQIDEETLEVKGIIDGVNYVKENKPWLINTKKATGMVSERPLSENGVVTYENLSKPEQDALFREALGKI